MFGKILVFLVFYQYSQIYAHLILNIPEVWGINNGVSLEQPLDISTFNPICAGKSPENNGIVKFVAGQTHNFDVICGEKDINAPGCLKGDWHAGDNVNDYSGCALSVSYNGYNEQNDFKYISYSKDCAKRGVPTSFIISKNIKNCEKCICSWSIAPSIEYSSPGQFYHNCFYCSISGGNTNVTMRTLDFINVKGAKYQDVTYNDINPSDIYKTTSVRNTVNKPTSVRNTVHYPVRKNYEDFQKFQTIFKNKKENACKGKQREHKLPVKLYKRHNGYHKILNPTITMKTCKYKTMTKLL